MNKSLTILHIVESDINGGSGRCAIEIMQLLKDNPNYKFIFITLTHNKINDICDLQGVENYCCHYGRTCSLGMGLVGWLIAFIMRPILNRISYLKLKKYIDFKKIDIIHTNNTLISFGAFLHKKLNIPHIWHIREFLVFNRVMKPIIHRLPQYICNNSSMAITVSSKLQNYCISQGFDKNKIITINDGVPKPKAFVKKKESHLNILKVVCVGAINKNKGQHTIIDAISKIPKEMQEHFSIDFWGDGLEQDIVSIQKHIESTSLSSLIHLRGYSNNITEILSNYDIGIQPSLTEGFSRVTVEYMLAHLCVIATRETSENEPIVNEKNGYLYTACNSEELAKIMITLYENQSIIYCLGKQAQTDALENYCMDSNISKLTDVYKKVLTFNAKQN